MSCAGTHPNPLSRDDCHGNKYQYANQGSCSEQLGFEPIAQALKDNPMLFIRSQTLRPRCHLERIAATKSEMQLEEEVLICTTATTRTN